jgi:hypothetical protein
MQAANLPPALSLASARLPPKIPLMAAGGTPTSASAASGSTPRRTTEVERLLNSNMDQQSETAKVAELTVFHLSTKALFGTRPYSLIEQQVALFNNNGHPAIEINDLIKRFQRRGLPVERITEHALKTEKNGEPNWCPILEHGKYLRITEVKKGENERDGSLYVKVVFSTPADAKADMDDMSLGSARKRKAGGLVETHSGGGGGGGAAAGASAASSVCDGDCPIDRKCQTCYIIPNHAKRPKPMTTPQPASPPRPFPPGLSPTVPMDLTTDDFDRKREAISKLKQEVEDLKKQYNHSQWKALEALEATLKSEIIALKEKLRGL